MHLGSPPVAVAESIPWLIFRFAGKGGGTSGAMYESKSALYIVARLGAYMGCKVHGESVSQSHCLFVLLDC